MDSLQLISRRATVQEHTQGTLRRLTLADALDALKGP